MIKFAGKIIGKRNYPYVYFIIKDSYLYIGETQDIPIRRWRDHLDINGSFSKKLRSMNEDVFYESSDIKFYAYKCKKIKENAKEVERRLVTQYVEHRLHEEIICHRDIGPKFEIISNTIRTAPKRCKYDWADDLVRDVISEFVAEINCSNWIAPQCS